MGEWRWTSLRTDIRNAGRTWEDEQVQVCWAGPNTPLLRVADPPQRAEQRAQFVDDLRRAQELASRDASRR